MSKALTLQQLGALIKQRTGDAYVLHDDEVLAIDAIRQYPQLRACLAPTELFQPPHLDTSRTLLDVIFPTQGYANVRKRVESQLETHRLKEKSRYVAMDEMMSAMARAESYNNQAVVTRRATAAGKTVPAFEAESMERLKSELRMKERRAEIRNQAKADDLKAKSTLQNEWMHATRVTRADAAEFDELTGQISQLSNSIAELDKRILMLQDSESPYDQIELRNLLKQRELLQGQLEHRDNLLSPKKTYRKS